MKHDKERAKHGWFNWFANRNRITPYDDRKKLEKLQRMVSHRRVL